MQSFTDLVDEYLHKPFEGFVFVNKSMRMPDTTEDVASKVMDSQVVHYLSYLESKSQLKWNGSTEQLL